MSEWFKPRSPSLKEPFQRQQYFKLIVHNGNISPTTVFPVVTVQWQTDSKRSNGPFTIFACIRSIVSLLFTRQKINFTYHLVYLPWDLRPLQEISRSRHKLKNMSQLGNYTVTRQIYLWDPPWGSQTKTSFENTKLKDFLNFGFIRYKHLGCFIYPWIIDYLKTHGN